MARKCFRAYNTILPFSREAQPPCWCRHCVCAELIGRVVRRNVQLVIPRRIRWKRRQFSNKFRACGRRQGQDFDVNKSLAKTGNAAPRLLIGRQSETPLVGRPVMAAPCGPTGQSGCVFHVTSHVWPWLLLFWNFFSCKCVCVCVHTAISSRFVVSLGNFFVSFLLSSTCCCFKISTQRASVRRVPRCPAAIFHVRNKKKLVFLFLARSSGFAGRLLLLLKLASTAGSFA